ncbi:PilX N-terminal domain-containing pilus assembly protein [Sphingomonas sp. NCPPB 2930]
MSLIIVLMILVVVSLLGISAAQISTLAERTARNDRDLQMAWEGAEAGLVDAEFDMRTVRQDTFGQAGLTSTDISKFTLGCGVNGTSQGLCLLPTAVDAKPAWLTVDLSAGTNTVIFGDQTKRAFPSGNAAQPFSKPNYIIEAIRDSGDGSRDRSATDPGYVFRVTAMGYGPGQLSQSSTQAVVQMIFRN